MNRMNKERLDNSKDRTDSNKDRLDNKDKQWKWLQMLLRILRMLIVPTPSPSPERMEGSGKQTGMSDQPQTLMTSPTQSQVSPLKGGRGGLTASAATSVRKPASATSGLRYCVPLSKSQLSSWLRLESKALQTLPNPPSKGGGLDSMCGGRRIDYLVLHCSDTRPDQDFTVEKLQQCHAQRGFGRYPGYHVYVRRDGTCYLTRPLQMRGCHVKGYNSWSIGVCYEGGKALGGMRSLSQCDRPSMADQEGLDHGTVHAADQEGLLTRGGGYTPVPYGHSGAYEDNRTEAQKVALREVFRTLHELFPTAKIVGHNELGAKKACPCLSKESMEAFRREVIDPPPPLPSGGEQQPSDVAM